MAKVKLTCGKCGGSGFLSHYRAISAGTCFACDGKGYYFRTEQSIKNKEKREQQKQEKANKMKQYNEEKMMYFISEFKSDQDFLKRMDGRDPEEGGYQLAFNIMQCYESWGKFKYNIEKPS